MQHGTSLEWGSPDALAQKYLPHKRVRVSVTLPAHLELLRGMPGVEALEVTGSDGVVEVPSFDVVPDIVSRLVSAGAMISSVSPLVPNLEDIYFAIRRENGSSADELPPPPSPTTRPSRSRVAELAR
jgi:hypothetical protein